MAVRGFFYNATDLNDKEHMYNGQDMNEDKAPFYKEGVAYGHLQVTAPGGTMEVTVVRIYQFTYYPQYRTIDPYIEPGKRNASKD